MRFTRKQLGGYAKANRSGISMNDAYNQQAFGITKEQHSIIRRAELETHGIGGDAITLAELNRRV